MKPGMKNHQEKGQSLIEFTAIVMLMIIIVAGIVDLGRMFAVYINLRDAAEEGVIYGSITPIDCAGIEDRVMENVNDAAGVSVAISVASVDCSVAAATPHVYAKLGEEIRVVVTIEEFPLAAPVISSFIGQTIRLRSTMTGTILRPLVEGFVMEGAING